MCYKERAGDCQILLPIVLINYSSCLSCFICFVCLFSLAYWPIIAHVPNGWVLMQWANSLLVFFHCLIRFLIIYTSYFSIPVTQFYVRTAAVFMLTLFYLLTIICNPFLCQVLMSRALEAQFFVSLFHSSHLSTWWLALIGWVTPYVLESNLSNSLNAWSCSSCNFWPKWMTFLQLQKREDYALMVAKQLFNSAALECLSTLERNGINFANRYEMNKRLASDSKESLPEK